MTFRLAHFTVNVTYAVQTWSVLFNVLFRFQINIHGIISYFQFVTLAGHTQLGKQRTRTTSRYIYVAVNFCFFFVLNSLAYKTIPKNNGKIKINWDEKLTTTSTQQGKAFRAVRQSLGTSRSEDGDGSENVAENVAYEQGLLFGLRRSLARETRFTRPNRRACSHATENVNLRSFNLHHDYCKSLTSSNVGESS